MFKVIVKSSILISMNLFMVLLSFPLFSGIEASVLEKTQCLMLRIVRENEFKVPEQKIIS